MTKFIKLSKVFINPNAITKITHSNTKYIGNCYNIHLTNPHIDGVFVLYFGRVTSVDNIIAVTEKEDESDYNIINKWLENN